MKINILDHLPDKTFIYLEDKIRQELFSKSKKVSLTNLSKELGLTLKNLSRYNTGARAIPKLIFLELIKKSGMDLDSFQNNITIKVGKNGNTIKTGLFVDIDSRWIYIAELIRGDGSLCRGNNNSYTTHFTNKNLFLIEFVRTFFLSFGIKDQNIGIYPNSKDPNVKDLTIHSEAISYLLNSFFKIPFGHKKDMSIPGFIAKDKNFTMSAIRGIFDAEGNITFNRYGKYYKRKIIIAMNAKTYIRELMALLNKLNIHPRFYEIKNKGMFRLEISDRSSIIRFYKKISPLHPEKNKKLKQIVKDYQSMKWIATSDIAPKILRLLGEGSKKRLDICNKLKISYSKAGGYLSKLKKDGLIKVEDKVFTNNGSWFMYGITSKGRDYLKEKNSDFW